ncbi:winged helix-turn-helix transcriptional regulator [Symbioplanes lichenis]|uniref:winged helix-turn-helix transcriptional regulator n=1 Tax=Symbioplanes lichenis TaxID=1629072 RepID=UPI0027397C68|nr:helix-turn-helix domain-containing protein [Actinoplanes lichenis]
MHQQHRRPVARDCHVHVEVSYADRGGHAVSQTLRALTADGLVTRRVEASVPPRVFYALTPLDRSLDEPLAALREWAERHMPEIRDFRAQAPPAGGR